MVGISFKVEPNGVSKTTPGPKNIPKLGNEPSSG